MRNEGGGVYDLETPQMNLTFKELPLGEGAAKPGIECLEETYFCTGDIKSNEK